MLSFRFIINCTIDGEIVDSNIRATPNVNHARTLAISDTNIFCRNNVIATIEREIFSNGNQAFIISLARSIKRHISL